MRLEGVPYAAFSSAFSHLPSAASAPLAEAMYANGCIPVSGRRIGRGWTSGHQSATPADRIGAVLRATYPAFA